MKIIKLKAENIKKLVAVEITPTGSVIKITGKNASGKTSVLDAIFWALGGLNNIQTQPIRKGQTKAKVEIDLGEMVVKRTFNEGGTTSLNIENKDGLRFKSPQTMLDGLLGKLSFDPLEFMRQDSRKQFETLRQLTGVDFSKLDGLRQRTYDGRAATNRDVRRLEVQIETIRIPDNPSEVKEQEVDIAELMEKVGKARAKNREGEKLQTVVKERNRDINEATQRTTSLQWQIAQEQSSLEDDITTLEQQISHRRERHNQKYGLLQKEKEKEQQHLKDSQSEYTQLEKQLESFVFVDVLTIQANLEQAEKTNRVVREAIRIYEKAIQDTGQIMETKKQARSELRQLKEAAQNLTSKIQGIDEEKQKQIAEAKFPLDGLSFGDGAVTYNDLPMDQASHAEQLRVSMAMAMSLNPKLKVIRITDGSLLDSQSMRVIEDMAKDQDYQVWIEQTDESGKVGIVISEGEVVAVNE